MAAVGNETTNSMNERAGISRAVFVVVGLLLFSGAGLLLAMFLLPPVYFARVTMEVKSSLTDSAKLYGANAQRGLDPMFVPMQISILRSRGILNHVIQNLALEAAWSKDAQPLSMEQAFARLVNGLEFRNLGGEGMIEIGAYSGDPQEAANIANTIAVVYLQMRLADFQKDANSLLAELKDEVGKQRLRAEAASVEAVALRERDGIVDPNPNQWGASLTSLKGQESLNSYVKAKTHAMQGTRIYEAAKRSYSEAILNSLESHPATIWEKAEPPVRPIGFSFRRITHAFSR